MTVHSTNGVEPAYLLSSSLEDEVLVDPTSRLLDLIETSGRVLSQEAIMEAVYLEIALGDYGVDMVKRILMLKSHQNPWVQGRLMRMFQAMFTSERRQEQQGLLGK